MGPPRFWWHRVASPDRCNPFTHSHSTGSIYYCRIDLYKDESHITFFNDDAEAVEEIHVANVNLNEVAGEYAGANPRAKQPVNYYTVYDTLNEHFDVVVADPTQANWLY